MGMGYPKRDYRCIIYNVRRAVSVKWLRECDVLWEHEDHVIVGYRDRVPEFAKQMRTIQENLDTKLVEFDEPFFNAWVNVALVGQQDTKSKAFKMAVALAA